jgi:hypothetical protein
MNASTEQPTRQVRWQTVAQVVLILVAFVAARCRLFSFLLGDP